MDRKKFIQLSAFLGAGLLLPYPGEFPYIFNKGSDKKRSIPNDSGLNADLVIAGGSLGACAAAMASLRNGLSVIMTNETDWIGGQLTSQGVPPDEHQWIETHGSTRLYRELRFRIRQYYRNNYSLTETAKKNPYLNPGDGSVSRLCHEPRVALSVLEDMLYRWIKSEKLILLNNYKITGADLSGNNIRSLAALNLLNGNQLTLYAPYFIDATELGELLPLTGTTFVTGTESRADTSELHAPEKADPDNNQAFTLCFTLDYLHGENHVIEKPHEYDFWHDYIPHLNPAWPGKLLSLKYSRPADLLPAELGFDPQKSDTSPLLNLWDYRRIINKDNFAPGTFKSDITLINWPQNDYMNGNIIGVTDEEFKKQIDGARQLNLSLLYWLQTEVPRHGKGYGWPGLRLRGDVMGSADGMAKYPYIRESRRIKPLFRILEKHVGKENKELETGKKDGLKSAFFYDSVGVGYYHIDLHPGSSGTNYIDFDSLPFQIPLGALIPESTSNLIAGCKNIGTTHITNGCYRLHPVEWNIGESAGSLAAFAFKKKTTPFKIRENKDLLEEFQNSIRLQGIETEWPEG